MQSDPARKNRYVSPFKRLMAWTVIGVAPLAALLAYSETASAGWQNGLFSFMSSVVGSQQASAKVSHASTTLNSQTIALLAAAANIDPNPDKPANDVPINAGEALVPEIAAANATTSENYNTQISVYVVREGDTISTVAKMFNVSVNTVLWANNLTGKSVLRPGQTLTILPISGIKYTVKKGDTIKGIAQRYGADSTDILTYNDLTLASTLPVGQTILIPDGELSAAETVHNAQSSAPRGTVSERLLDGWNYPAMPGYFIRPIIGGHKSQGLHGHNGVDLAAPVGTPIRAAASGVVIIDKQNSAWNGGYGNYVVISHPNGTQTLYAHMLRSAVSLGETVDQGETIGYIGMTGQTTGPHVHFEIRGAQNPF